MRLNPLSPDMHRIEVGIAMAHQLAGHAEDALSWAERASRHLPDRVLPITILAAIYTHAGRGEEAGRMMQRLSQLDQAPRLSDLSEWLPFQRSQDLVVFSDALRDAGLPN
jgi:predicted Zn-dependent protease